MGSLWYSSLISRGHQSFHASFEWPEDRRFFETEAVGCSGYPLSPTSCLSAWDMEDGWLHVQYRRAGWLFALQLLLASFSPLRRRTPPANVPLTFFHFQQGSCAFHTCVQHHPHHGLQFRHFRQPQPASANTPEPLGAVGEATDRLRNRVCFGRRSSSHAAPPA